MTDVYFDCRYIRVDHHDGISRFTAGIFSALYESMPLVAIYSDPRQLEALPAGIKSVQLPAATHWSEPFAALRLNRLGAKVVYSPMQTIGTLGRKFKLVLTLHDLIYYSHPTPPPRLPLAVRIMWRLFHLWYWPQRMLLNSADIVVTVSETTKQLMLKHHLTRKPIEVVYNAAPEISGNHQRVSAVPPHGTKKLIYMGSFMGYKNVETLVSAMNQLQSYELHLLSRITSSRKAQLESLLQKTAGKVIFHNGVTDEKYHELLDGAAALVTASKDEGFGIPLIEAMAQGVPVVASDIAIFHEIGGEAALYFDADSPSEFAAKVIALASDAVWLEHSKKGIVQASKFSWKASADKLEQILRKL